MQSTSSIMKNVGNNKKSNNTINKEKPKKRNLRKTKQDIMQSQPPFLPQEFCNNKNTRIANNKT